MVHGIDTKHVHRNAVRAMKYLLVLSSQQVALAVIEAVIRSTVFFFFCFPARLVYGG